MRISTPLVSTEWLARFRRLMFRDVAMLPDAGSSPSSHRVVHQLDATTKPRCFDAVRMLGAIRDSSSQIPTSHHGVEANQHCNRKGTANGLVESRKCLILKGQLS